MIKISNMNIKRIGVIAIAVAIVLSVLFPINVTSPEPNTYVLTIGNIASAHEPDYTCDGTADHVQFQQILDALPADVGGRIEVEAGYYSFGANETVSRAIPNVTIIGVGGLVSFDGDDTTALFTAGGNNWKFQNIVTDAGGIDTGATSGYLLENVLVGTTFYTLVTDNINIENHSARHESGGDDEIKLDDLGTPDDNTDLNASTDRHGLLPKLAGNTSLYLRSDGNWTAVAGGSGDGDMLKATYDNDEDGLIDAAAGGTEWDSSAVTGVAYVTAGTWSSKTIGIADTNILVVSGTVNNGEHCRFTGTGIEGLTSAELLADLSGDATSEFDWNGQNLANVGTVDGRDVSADGGKLDGIEAGADVTDATNVAAAGALMDSDTDNVDDTHINWGSGAGQVDADDILESATKKWASETGADVTDATNVDSAGAVMETDYNATTFLYATLDDTPEAKSPAEVLAILSGAATAAFDFNGQNIINVGTVDGRDVSADGTKLDGIEAGADVTDSDNVNSAGAVMESDFDATTFLYATLDNTPEAKTPAEVRTILEVADITTGVITLYVDAGSGDDGNAGTSGSPKETIEGALDALPDIIAHTCTIKVRGQQDYAEGNSRLEFSRFTTLASIVIKTVNSNDEDMYDNGNADAGAGNDELEDGTKSWSTDQFAGAYCWIYEGTGAGQIREIDSNDDTTLTLTSTWTTNPDATSYYAIGGGATLTGTDAYHIFINGKNVDVYGFRHTGATSADLWWVNSSFGQCYYNYFDTSVWGAICRTHSEVYMYYNFSESSTVAYQIAYMSTGWLRSSVASGSAYGLQIDRGAINFFISSTGSLCYFDSCGTYGVQVKYGSGGMYADSQVYNSCSAYADATSWKT